VPSVPGVPPLPVNGVRKQSLTAQIVDRLNPFRKGTAPTRGATRKAAKRR
jgi:hypothetical protein